MRLLFILMVFLAIISGFVAGAVEGIIHYDGYWSTFKVCVGAGSAYILTQLFFKIADDIMKRDDESDKETDS